MRTMYRIAARLLDDVWRTTFIEELGDAHGPTAFVFAAHRTDKRLGS